MRLIEFMAEVAEVVNDDKEAERKRKKQEQANRWKS